MDNSRLNVLGRIEGGELLFKTADYSRIKGFTGEHDGKDVEVSYVVPDGVRYWQHKYYRGFVLPDIAEGMGEADAEYLHEFVLKREFLTIPVADYREIPPRHHKGVRIIMAGEQVVAYVPSMAALNFDEARAFILGCEKIRDGLIDWSHHESNKDYIRQYMEYRAKALGGAE